MFRPMTRTVLLQRFARRTRPFNPPPRVPIGLIGPPARAGHGMCFVAAWRGQSVKLRGCPAIYRLFDRTSGVLMPVCLHLCFFSDLYRCIIHAYLSSQQELSCHARSSRIVDARCQFRYPLVCETGIFVKVSRIRGTTASHRPRGRLLPASRGD